MPRHGENIFKRKDGRWEGRYISSYNENGKATITLLLMNQAEPHLSLPIPRELLQILLHRINQ